MIRYFGYGAMNHAQVIAAVIGRTPEGEAGRLRGMRLCIQRIDQIPAKAQEILRRSWPDTFTSYTIDYDAGSAVSGVVWSITHEERKLIRNWELVDEGWFYPVSADVIIPRTGRLANVYTEILRHGQEFDRDAYVDDAAPLLSPLADIVRVAEKARTEFLASA